MPQWEVEIMQPGGGARGATSKSIPWFPQDKACIRVSTIDRPFSYHLKDKVYTNLKANIGYISINASQSSGNRTPGSRLY